MFVLGITFVQSNTIERDIALKPGESAQLGGYQFRYEGGQGIVGPELRGLSRQGLHHAPGCAGHRAVSREAPLLGAGHGADHGGDCAPAFGRDLLAALGEDVGAGAWSLRLQYRPLIRFIWIGALIMAIGGVTSVVGRRRRAAATDGVSLPLGAAAPGRLQQQGRLP
jgi:cytochrome c-type biogenesis protein CcmF